MKINVENANEDKDFYQAQLFKAKKVNKALIIELEKGNLNVPLMITSGIDEEKSEKPLSIMNEVVEELKDSPRIEEESLAKIFETEPPNQLEDQKSKKKL